MQYKQNYLIFESYIYGAVLKKLAIEYKNQKDLEIKNLNKDIDKFKKSTDEHKSADYSQL